MLAIGFVFLVSACEAGSSGEAQGHAGPLTFTTGDIQVLGGSDVIAQVNDLEVLPDGSVWLLNSVQPFFVGLDGSGAVRATYGTSGGGPEEFRMPAGFVTGGLGDGVWVLDFIRHALIKVSQPDETWSQLSVPRDAVPLGSLRGGLDITSLGVRTARLGQEVILPRTSGSMEDGIFSFRMSVLGADLVAFDPGTGSVRHVVSLREALDDPGADFEATEGGLPLWYRLWAVCGGNQIRVYDRARNQLRGFDGQGNEIEAVALPPVRLTEVTPRQFARAIFPLRQAEVTGEVGSRLNASDSLRVINEIIQGIKGEPHQLAGYLPRYVDFRCTDDGTMWMHPLDLQVGGLEGGPTWLRIAQDGVTREVRLPERFDALRFTASRIWGVQRDEFDVASVAWIEFP